MVFARTRTLSATTLESTASIPPPSAAVMNSCVLYASSGHFFRRGNGGSKVGPETNHHDPLRFSIFDFFNLRTRGTADYTVHALDRLFLKGKIENNFSISIENSKRIDFYKFFFSRVLFFFYYNSHSYKRTC